MPMKTSGTHLIHCADRRNIVLIADARQRQDETADEAWQRFATAQQRSKETLSIKDGITAAKAYADFLDLYVRRRA